MERMNITPEGRETGLSLISAKIRNKRLTEAKKAWTIGSIAIGGIIVMALFPELAVLFAKSILAPVLIVSGKVIALTMNYGPTLAIPGALVWAIDRISNPEPLRK